MLKLATCSLCKYDSINNDDNEKHQNNLLQQLLPSDEVASNDFKYVF